MSLSVIKIGGSLMGAPELPLWLNRIESASETNNYLIVPGGGKFADSIRDLQHEYQFDDVAAHQMALLAMCQFGYYLAHINPKLITIKSDEDLYEKTDNKFPLIWLPYSLITEHSELEYSWDVTSDSIALWLATKLNAEKLILVKSIELSSDRSEIENHKKNNAVDQSFTSYAEKYKGEILFYSKSEYSDL